jgi:hypothetical protein
VYPSGSGRPDAPAFRCVRQELIIMSVDPRCPRLGAWIAAFNFCVGCEIYLFARRITTKTPKGATA